MTLSSTQPSRPILRRIISVIVGVLTPLAALVAGIFAPYYLSVHIPETSLLTLASILVFAAIAWLGLRLGAALWRHKKPARVAAMGAGALSAIFLIALYLLILRPAPPRYTEVIPAENAKFWHLPTGSTISYQEFLPPSGTAVKPDPIVFLHGGPGLRFAPFDSDIYGSFSADGFRVYLYDQAGSGASAFHAHIREYTIERSVEDLEAIRKQLHVDRMILIGHSWGSTLAASYIAKYPTHVSKVVFHSPGALWKLDETTPFEWNRTDADRPQIEPSRISLRLLAALYLQERNPDAAERLLPQQEAEERMAPPMAHGGDTLVCKGHSSMVPKIIAGVESQTDNPGLNPYVMEGLVGQTEAAEGDPHAALQGNKTGAILLVGECNYIPWEVALDYRRTFSNLKIFYFPNAGHYLQFEQPELMAKVIRNFLLDQPDAISPYVGNSDPSPLPK
jgi:pimeloyl-ACP methyl ester carboxylesterase